jgi:hypothetical protein
LRTLLKRRGLEDAIDTGEISLTDDNVSDFLDLVEGRLFSDDALERNVVPTRIPRGSLKAVFLSLRLVDRGHAA